MTEHQRQYDHYAEVKRRIATAAFKPRANDNVRRLVFVRPPPPPQWTTEQITFDSHVLAHYAHKARNGYPKRAYIATRAAELGFTFNELVAKSRKVHLVAARQLLMWEVKRNWPETTYPELARIFGGPQGMDHTTCLHAVRKIERLKGEGKL